MDLKDTTYQKSERVATITYNRPEKMNAWTPRMFDELRAAPLTTRKVISISARSL
ncbi:MAG: hypothetical protein JO166_08765 [Deltaproteobacteria bacterium]|nr:hypothetical protein [Deltaproteobacteria bacterium]